MQLFDSHCHIHDEQFDTDRNEIIEKIFSSGVSKIISAGYSVEGSKKGLELAKKYPQIYTVSGISPNDVVENVEEMEADIKQIEILAQDKKCVGIGEIGLDYYWNKENKSSQKFAFIKQIELANKLDLPIVIHSRDAVMDTLEILKKYPVNKKGVFHCCQLNPELIKEALKLGFYISFAGPVTFKNSKNANEVILLVPDDKMLIETDSPYLSPEPHRGTRNDSSNVKYIAEKIANVKGYTVEQVAQITYDNACRLFNIL
jgi:TatD DNase family protein